MCLEIPLVKPRTCIAKYRSRFVSTKSYMFATPPCLSNRAVALRSCAKPCSAGFGSGHFPFVRLQLSLCSASLACVGEEKQDWLHRGYMVVAV